MEPRSQVLSRQCNSPESLEMEMSILTFTITLTKSSGGAVQSMDSMKWQVADMLSLPFQDRAFDAVIEKGTMDVLFVDNDSPWDPHPEVRERVECMLDETHR